MGSALMVRLFLAWIAAVAAASWVGITLAAAGAFAIAPVVAGAVLAAAALLLALRGAPRFVSVRGGFFVPLLAFTLTATLLPVVDTTLLSQDASIHRASGRWLARSGALGIPDDSLAALSEDDRLQLLGGASLSPPRMSLTRLPGGVVLPDLAGTVAYPSFSHLLPVWVAIAESLGGERAVAMLGPACAATAWWAIGLLALLDAGLLAALAAPLLLAALLPEHWFARYLMPEILAQALVWSGVAAGRLADVAAAPRARRAAATLCGVALGVSGFARLEQFWVFVPALLLTRALLPRDRRLLPRGALLPLVLLAAQAGLHAFIVPTDYANRIYKTALHAYAPFVVLVSTLTGHDGYVTGFILNRVLPVGLVVALAAWISLGRLVDRRCPGFLRRWSAGAVGLPWLALLYGDGLPDHFAALRSVLLYVPWTILCAIALGALRARRWAGLEIALVLQALDQLVNARVTDLQPWASRRVVTVVLPVLVLAAVRALAPVGTAVAARGAPFRPALERRVAAALVLVTIVLGALRVTPVVGRRLQTGGADLVRRIAAAVPESSYVILAEPLGWIHLAPALWLGEGPTTLVAREQEWFAPALARFLDLPAMRDRPLYVLSGGIATADGPVDPRAVAPPLPDGFGLEQVATFAWPTTLLETTVERRPETIGRPTLDLVLYRIVRPPR